MYLITVGKLKDKNLEAIEEQYLCRINSPKLNIIEVKAKAEKKELEGSEVLKKISSLSKNPVITILTEFGKQKFSEDFSKWQFDLLQENSDLFYVICGAEGPSAELLNAAHHKISLGKITLPHKLARIVLVEQIYRAQTIYQKHPYHN